jgi:hypothetical protein
VQELLPVVCRKASVKYFAPGPLVPDYWARAVSESLVQVSK